ncbi:MAG: nucleotidyl transferase AbiEii/AbiGii toxin family protein [Comamonadaceae bacterium]|nr:MAG: nucleotidyl transferase AbiEii/AbiGii toxin family protein [Comamonadaceae bacterium]
MPDRPRNVGAFVRQRLLNLAHARGQPMELLLTRYALERLLHRLSLSPHRERFVLKGAMLLATWFDEPHRATRDVDLLGFGDATKDALLGTFREIMAVEVDDGMIFDLKGLRIEAIREEVEYGGSRLRTTAALAGARIPITVDIGFGDAVEPGVDDIDLPVLLDMPSPRLRAYPPETVIAEKFHAMVVLGRANSRMKDYYDVWMLTSAFEIDPERLRRAIAATFSRRGTAIPAEVPDGITEAFATDPAKQRQWDAFSRNLVGLVPEFGLVVRDLRYRLKGFLAQS